MYWVLALLLVLVAAIAGVDARDVVVKADDPNGGLQYIGNDWHAGKADSLGDCISGAVYRFSYTAGDGWSLTFTGTAVRVNVLGSFDRGIVKFELDGSDTATVDTYSALRRCQVPFQRSNLENKSHTIKATFIKGSPQETAEQLKDAPPVIVIESIVYTVPDVVQPPNDPDPTTPTTAPPAQTTGSGTGNTTGGGGGGNSQASPSTNQPTSNPSVSVPTNNSGSSSGSPKPSSTDPTPNNPSTTNSQTPGNANVNLPSTNSSPNIGVIVGSVVAGLVLVVIFLVFLWWRRRRQAQGGRIRPISTEEDGYEVHYNRPSAWPISFHLPPRTPRTPHTPNVPRAPVPPLPPITRQQNQDSPNSLHSLTLLQRPEDTPPMAARAIRRLPQTPETAPTLEPEPEPDPSIVRMAASRASRSEKSPQYVLVNPGPPTGIPHTPWGPATRMQGFSPYAPSPIPRHTPSVPSEAPSSPISSPTQDSRSESTRSPQPGDSVSMVSGFTASTSMFRAMSDTEMERLARHVVTLMREETTLNPIPGAAGPDLPPPQYEDNPFRDVGTAR